MLKVLIIKSDISPSILDSIVKLDGADVALSYMETENEISFARNISIPDVIVMSYLKVTSENFSSVQFIRKTPVFNSVPIVLVARIIDDSSVDKCFQNDISDILIFPATHAILKMRLRNCILVAGMKKKLHDNDLQMEAAFEIAQIGTWEYLTTENVTHYSKQWNSIFGNMADRGNSTTVNAYPDGNFWNSDAFSRHISGQRESYVNEYHFIHPEKGNVYIRSFGRVTEFDLLGNPLKMIGVHINITSHKVSETQLIKAENAVEKSKNAEVQFLAHVSHEMRTPLNAIIGMTHLLRNTGLNVEQEDYVKAINTSGDLLLSIISDILDYNKIESGEMEIINEPFSLYDLLESVKGTFLQRFREKPINFNGTFEKILSTKVKSDSKVIKQILYNILSNAYKFTQKGEVIFTAKVSQKTEHGFNVLFSIKDTGAGIPKNRQRDIFERFSQIRNQSTGPGGSGLGLTITKMLVDKLKGRIWLESEQGLGSIFYIEIPFEFDEIVFGGHEQAGYNANSTNLVFDEPELNEEVVQPVLASCLVAEDNPFNSKYLLNLLKKWDITAEVGVDGVEALALSKKKKYQIILMDIGMPNMDGYQTTEAIRSDSSNPNFQTPIIALTGYALASQRQKALDTGMNYYITKPYTPEVLLEHLKKVISFDNATGRASVIMPEPAKTKQNAKSKFQSVSEFKRNNAINQRVEPKVEPFVAQPKVNTKRPSGFSGQQPDLDYEFLEELYGNDMEYASQMMQLFIESLPDQLAQLEEAAMRENYSVIQELSHKIKPTFSMVGLTALNKKALDIETKAKARTDIKSLKSEVFDFYQETLVKMSQIISEKNSIIG